MSKINEETRQIKIISFDEEVWELLRKLQENQRDVKEEIKYSHDKLNDRIDKLEYRINRLEDKIDSLLNRQPTLNISTLNIFYITIAIGASYALIFK